MGGSDFRTWFGSKRTRVHALPTWILPHSETKEPKTSHTAAVPCLSLVAIVGHPPDESGCTRRGYLGGEAVSPPYQRVAGHA